MSVRDYYYYKFQMRPRIFNPILHGKRIFRHFAVDSYVKSESSRLDYFPNNQDQIRADLYQGLVDSLHAARVEQMLIVLFVRPQLLLRYVQI